MELKGQKQKETAQPIKLSSQVSLVSESTNLLLESATDLCSATSFTFGNKFYRREYSRLWREKTQTASSFVFT
ncbi:hypothetical protein AAC387_Pa11g1197 [Persea americana]